MSDFKMVIENIKSLSVENLSDSELDVLKEQIIKLLVDIQIQKDINKKISEVHTSTDDVQLEIMQKINSTQEKTESLEDKKVNEEKEYTNENTKDIPNENYQSIIQTEIPEDIVSIYTKIKEPDITQLETQQHQDIENADVKKTNIQNTDTTKDVTHKTLSHRIVFTINDKFRILKKLFHNNNKEYEHFINELNNIEDYTSSESLIRQYLEKNNWDENSMEYQILIKQNKRRFNSLL